MSRTIDEKIVLYSKIILITRVKQSDNRSGKHERPRESTNNCIHCLSFHQSMKKGNVGK
jgi:hypothetical protein